MAFNRTYSTHEWHGTLSTPLCRSNLLMRCSSRASGINASGLFREALAEQMAYRDIDRDELSILIEEALTDTNRDLDDLLDQTSTIVETGVSNA